MITKQEFQEECKIREFRLKDDFFEKIVDHFQKKHEIDDKFFEALQKLALYPSKGTLTICKVFKVLNAYHNDDEVVKWLCLIGDRMGKRMQKKIVERGKQLERMVK